MTTPQGSAPERVEVVAESLLALLVDGEWVTTAYLADPVDAALMEIGRARVSFRHAMDAWSAAGYPDDGPVNDALDAAMQRDKSAIAGYRAALLERGR